MARTLQSEGILNNNLFLVQGDLVEYYNRALKHVIGKKTSLTSFHIDKRGESPEIEAELGQNYLQSGPSNRYMIVVSPEQKGAELIHEEFSFDNDVIDSMYNNNLSGISIATRVDGLYGELNDDVRVFTCPEDMLAIRKINLELHTPSGFITKARDLQNLIESFKKNPELIIENDSTAVKQLSTLFQEVGDIRGYNITDMKINNEVFCFFSRVFDGVYVFRDLGTDTIKPKRPKRSRKKIVEVDTDIIVDAEMLNEFISSQGIRADISDSKLSPDYCVVIYKKNGFKHTDGPNVKFISLEDGDAVTGILIDNKYVTYSQQLVESRMTRLEDMFLLKKGFLSIVNY